MQNKKNLSLTFFIFLTGIFAFPLFAHDESKVSREIELCSLTQKWLLIQNDFKSYSAEQNKLNKTKLLFDIEKFLSNCKMNEDEYVPAELKEMQEKVFIPLEKEIILLKAEVEKSEFPMRGDRLKIQICKRISTSGDIHFFNIYMRIPYIVSILTSTCFSL